MSRHLKSIIKNRLKGIISYYAPHSEISASHRRGVRYIVPIECYDGYWGAMNTVKEGHHYKKHIIVRRVPRGRARLLQLYTYHFPKSWSAACIANRELIKEAQRRAHALEHDHSLAALEWRIRFFKHYFNVFRGGAKPEPGMKPYSYFYQYTYVAIYRELKAAQKQAEEVSFEPVSEPASDTPHILTATELLSPLLRRSKYSGKKKRSNSCIYEIFVVSLQPFYKTNKQRNENKVFFCDYCSRMHISIDQL